MSESKSSPRLIRAAIREAEALSLRLAGYSYGEIASELGYANASGAHKAVMRALEKLHPVEKAEKLRRIEAARLDRLWRRLWAKLEEGDLSVVDRLLKIMERRARLLGLDAPARAGLVLSNGKEPLRLVDLFPPEMVKGGVNVEGNGKNGD